MPNTDHLCLLVEAANNVSSGLHAELLRALPHHGVGSEVVWRVKTKESIVKKIERRKELGLSDDFINDLIGLRVVVSHSGLIQNAMDCINSWLLSEPNYCITGTRDYFSNPRSSHYRAVHLDLVFALPGKKKPDEVGVEIQITTYMQSYLAAISHDLLYKVSPPHPETDQRLLDEIQQHIDQVDKVVSSAFSRL